MRADKTLAGRFFYLSLNQQLQPKTMATANDNNLCVSHQVTVCPDPSSWLAIDSAIDGREEENCNSRHLTTCRLVGRLAAPMTVSQGLCRLREREI